MGGEANGGGPLSWGGWYFGVAGRPQTYLNLLYLLLGLPLGVAYFVVIVTLVSTAAGLTVTLVGLPLLVASMYAWCLLAGFERLQCNLLLGTRIGTSPFGREQGRPWEWRRIRARLRNGATWRSLLFLLFRFPHGTGTFIVAVLAVSVPAWLVAAPAVAATGGAEFGRWELDSAWEGAPFVLPGILLFPLFLRVSNFVAALSGRLTALLLDWRGEAAGSAAVDRAAASAATWRGLRLGQPVGTAEAKAQATQLRVFGVHAAIFAGLSSFFLLLNGMTTPGTWWCVWVIWGLAIPLAMHAGHLVRGFFGAHAGLFAVINLGLFAINASYSNTWWFFWPLLGWGLLVAGHWLAGDAIARRAAGQAAGWTPSRPGEGTPAGVAYGVPAQRPPGEEQPARGEAVAAQAAARVAAINVDVAMRVVRVSGEPVELTPKEFDLMALFVQNPGRPFSRAELLDRIWRNDYEVTDRTIDTHVQRLRKKLGEQSEAIQTVWGVGYRFQAAEGAGAAPPQSAGADEPGPGA
jgi:DNA-binding winged helix-turn-helix (wHTH) protein